MAFSFRLVFCSLIFLFCFSCSQKKPVAATPPPLPISAIKIVPQTIPADFEYVGVAESSHIVELRARVEGYLEQITYKEGGLVKAGDLMFVLDRRPFIANLDSNVGELASADATLWNSIQIRERSVPLFEQNALSERELDSAIAGEQSAQGQVFTAQANVESAQIQLGFASVSSPVTGYASKATFREGALIRSGFFSDLLTNIYVIDPIWVNINVPDSDILRMRKEAESQQLIYPENNNYKIEVILSDNSVFPTEGTVDFTDPAINQATGTMFIRTIFANPDAWLRPGQFARVIVKGAVRPNAISVPQTSVMQGPKGNFVYVVNSDGKVEVRAVTAGVWYKDYWIIQEGLKEGDVVVVDGVNRVGPGSVVQVKNWVKGP
ncbi:MAG: efflux RND transporter periplasmic adaptor subunit [Verrucomicrobia bacterium]|nr:efflux RND transporter periplasmic adaptor subunit [Verrucomicrobiota bacterium]